MTSKLVRRYTRKEKVRWLGRDTCVAEGCGRFQEVEDVCRKHWNLYLCGEWHRPASAGSWAKARRRKRR